MIDSMESKGNLLNSDYFNNLWLEKIRNNLFILDIFNKISDGYC